MAPRNCEIGIEVIDIHIHAVNRTARLDFLKEALVMADAAHAAGKKVGADERDGQMGAA